MTNQMFDKLSENDVRKCANHTYSFLERRGYLGVGRLNDRGMKHIREEVVADLFSAYASDDVLNVGEKNRCYTIEAVRSLDKQSQMNLLCEMFKRYYENVNRNVRVTISGKRVSAYTNESSLLEDNVNEESRNTLEDSVYDGRNEREEAFRLMKDQFNYQMSRLTDEWREAFSLILQDCLDGLTTTNTIKKGKFGCYIAENGELKVSQLACRMASEIVGYSEYTVRDRWNKWIEDMRSSYID